MTDSIILNKNHLRLVQQILKEHVPKNEVWAFGSRAGGRPKPHSDLDLVVVDPPSVSQSRLALLRLAFEESDLPIRVDLVIFSELDHAFQKLVSANHLLIM